MSEDNYDTLLNSDILLGEPLDTLRIKINGRNGVQETVPALHIGFMEIREFVHFKVPPVISNTNDLENSNAEKEEWLESMSFYEDDLHWLLKLPYHRFWSQIIHDENVHSCLESYLSVAPRSYDLLGLKLSEDVSVVLKKIHKLVFLIFLRMSTYKESKEHHLRSKAYGELIYEHFLFDVPKIMELCVLYGYQNKVLLTKMIKNIFTCQPKYLNDLHDTCSIILDGFTFAEGKLGILPSTTSGECRKLGDPSSSIMDMPLDHLCEIIGYVTDTSATIDMFLEVYSPACSIFYQNGAMLRIATFYEQAFAVLEKLLKKFIKMNEEESVTEDLKRRLTLSKSFLIRTFRNILNFCCIQFILDPMCREERVYRNQPAEEFLDIFMEIGSEKTFLKDYNAVHPFENDLELLNQTGAYLDPDRLNYIFGSIHDITQSDLQNFVSTAENGALPKKRNAPQSVESLQGVASILKQEISGGIENFSSGGYGVCHKEDDIQIDSLISSVKDLFPDFGEGFIEACLEHYSYSIDAVIDAYCNDKFPEPLKQLDRGMKRKFKPENSVQSINAPLLSERRNVFDGDEFDVFSRDDVNTQNIHLGKKNKTPNAYKNLKDTEESEWLKNLTLAYGENVSDSEVEKNLYEDEYDDTYDSAMVGLKEPMLEDEPDKEEAPDEPEMEPPSNSDFEKPGDFCINPEIQRQRYRQQQQSKLAARGKPVHADSSSGNSRQNKDRHKGQVANHNRRKQADFKRSRGMVPS